MEEKKKKEEKGKEKEKGQEEERRSRYGELRIGAMRRVT
jgi:hypothetical protein